MPTCKDLSGFLNKNDKKTEPKHPDYKGHCKIDGVQYWISSWIKRNDDGTAYMSLAFTKMERQDGGGGGRQQQKQSILNVLKALLFYNKGILCIQEFIP
jgi:hypothetical protein